MGDIPLIHTSKGNLPVASLGYKYGWEEDENSIIFWEEHWLGDEMVRRSAHVKSKKGIAALSALGEVS